MALVSWLDSYDIIIDENLKPWLLEVNASPSLSADTPDDYELKYGMLDDTFTIIDLEGRFPPGEHPERVGGFDLIWANRSMSSHCQNNPMGTFLGCLNEREVFNRKLFAKLG